MCSTRSPPPFPYQSAAHLDVAHTRHPSASAARLCAPLRLPASTAVSCNYLPPLFAALGLCPGPCQHLGGFVNCGSLRLPCAPALSSLSAPPNPIIFCFLVSLEDVFSREVNSPGRIHSPSFSCPSPCPPPRYLAIPEPFRLPSPPPTPYPLPPCLLDSIPVFRSQWGIGLEFGCTRACRCHGRGFSACKTEVWSALSSLLLSIISSISG